METQPTMVANSLASVEDVLEAFRETWNQHDMLAMGELFANDADFVNVLGIHFASKAEIAAAHEDLHKVRFARTHIRELRRQVAYLSPDIALAHVRWEMTGDPMAGPSGVRRGVLTHVLVRSNDRWYFRATQNTDIVAVPELAGHPFWGKYLSQG
ncbi:MAG TPA: SgcJ/EcaC family oxidoreductase [Candidatus Sulfotelmatobacter sp.]|nr:SgcJ/EcaC family oxidoreductase [Candidatus Sulfotelmatobacter sp.]